MNKTKLEEIKARICDDICQWPNVAFSAESLAFQCENCPLNELEADEEDDDV